MSQSSTKTTAQAQVASSLSGLSLLLTDSLGNLMKSSAVTVSESGAFIVNSVGIWLVIVFSQDDPAKVNMSLAIRTSTKMILREILNSGQDVVYNQLGTVSAQNPQNPLYVAIKIAVGQLP